MSGKHFTVDGRANGPWDDVGIDDASIDGESVSANGYLYTAAAEPGSDKIPIGPHTFLSMQTEGDGIDITCCCQPAEEKSRTPAGDSEWWDSVFECSNGHEIRVTWNRRFSRPAI